MSQQSIQNKLSPIAPLGVIIIAAIALIGWLTNHAALATHLPAIANMTFNTAFCFLMLGTACALPNTLTVAQPILFIIGLLIACIAGLSLMQDIFAVSLGVDHLLFDSSPYQLNTPFPGRMSSITASGFLFAATSLFCLNPHQHRTGMSLLLHGLILLIALIGLLGLGMNLLFGHAPAPFAQLASISTMTAISFLLLTTALLNRFLHHYNSDGHPFLFAGIRMMFMLKYPQKFAVISIVFVMPLLLLVWNELDTLNQDVNQAHLKMTGIVHIHQTIDLLNAIPEHRGMLNTHLADGKQYSLALQQSSTKIDQLFAQNDAMDQRNLPEIAIPKEWGQMEQRWAQIKQGSLNPLQAWRLHTEIISLLHKHLRGIGKSTLLAYDTDPIIHNLVSAQIDVLPQLFEQIGQLRGQGAAIIAHGKIDAEQRITLASQITQTTMLLDEYEQLIDSTWNADHPAPMPLQALHRDFVAGCTSFLALAEAQLINDNAFDISSKSYFDRASKALSSGFSFNHDSLEYVQQLLQQRIAHNLNRLYLIKLAILLAALLLLFLFSSFYQSIIRTIDMFHEAVEVIRQGRSNELTLLPARDEMVDAFNTLFAELIRINAQFSAIVDHVVDSIITIDREGKILSFNPAAEQLFGYRVAEVEGKNITMLMPERYRASHIAGLQHYATDATSKIVGNTTEAHGLKKDQSEFPLYLSISTMEVEGQRTYIGIIRDATQHKAMEEDLRHAQKMQAIGVLVAGVAHNFNNMLAGIVGQSYLAKIHCDANSQAIEYLDTIEDTSMQASEMVKQLLTFAHKDFLHDKQDISLNILLKETLKTARLGISEDIEIDIDMPGTTLMAHCDSSQIQQVVMNILNNARDALADTLSKRIHVSLQRYEPDAAFYQRHQELSPGSYAALHISDSGSGISDEIKEQIFEPFFTTKEVGAGTGLGLSTAFGSITSHHGIIEVETQNMNIPSDPKCPNHPNDITTFHIYLPLIEHESTQEQGHVSEVYNRAHGETLLLVDDDETVLEATAGALEQLGYTIITARDGRQGLQRFLEHRHAINAVITDVVMPRSGGMAMFHEIHAFNSTMPVIFLTGYDQDRISLDPDEEACSLILSKPIKISSLSQHLHDMLEEI